MSIGDWIGLIFFFFTGWLVGHGIDDEVERNRCNRLKESLVFSDKMTVRQLVFALYKKGQLEHQIKMSDERTFLDEATGNCYDGIILPGIEGLLRKAVAREAINREDTKSPHLEEVFRKLG